MGSSNTRPKLTQVVPSRSPLEREISQAEHQIGQPISNWTIKSLQSSHEVQEGSLGQRRNNQLPPLRQEVPLTFSPLAAGCMSHSLNYNLGPSIIQSFPPLRPQVLEPLARTTILREGGSKVQKRYLEAQAVLDRQAHIQRGSHRRWIREMQEQREQRRQGRTVYTGTVDREDYGNKVQRVHLVKRPTERDIFWDVSSEGELDFGDLSRGSPGPPECEKEMTSLPELHCSLSNKEVALEEPEQDHPRLSQEKTRSKKKKQG
ncbi:hypothetical protein GJAV_G00013500 [Gymnothorax javanicus]|nr:hypothetical protein GJAV_G00013500 [Gymnothorax javanicus]